VTPGAQPGGGHDDQVHAARVVLRPIANPFALGFMGLAGDTITVAGTELGWISHADALHAGLIVIIFAPSLQAIACVFGFLGRDAVAATGMGVLAGTWASIGAVMLTSPPGAASHALGTLLFLAAAAVLISATIAAATKLVPAIVMALVAARFTVTGIYQFIPDAGWKAASGTVGLVLGLAAVYGASSLELESMRRSPLLPVWRRGSGRQALTPDLSAQVSEVAAEAGVRKHL
jgi:succinate-acetate transporter protein